MADMQDYLRATEIIDWINPAVLQKAKELAGDRTDPVEISRRYFEWVRDEIMHSNDHKMNSVTLKASEVLKYGTGYCYAKSHLLAALLRANSIPCGICYQRLSIDDNGEPFCLHALNAVYLPEIGWYRMDARGNKEGVDARFTPPKEQLAFGINFEDEMDLPEIWPDPLPVVVDVLEKYSRFDEVAENLPDVLIIGKKKR
ncbi:transglutaminase-like putative cysteine protease [Methanohalophilus levihalophilus]|uniref:transglutaminase-like domain-containing protein n=1 Tax=Methanohalophilus levihalophilus TaxID=1431282 RepID=UPI001AE296B8|nr:transglutaminase family protein [Methanohalophilus levihalophilus]MBP2029913.1 transglutaminase-like putative cysteine protease [Methanohalophilus levihalophilus]